jgi:hypothetical protein
MRSSPAARALREAQSVAAYARRTGCDVDEAAGALATDGGVSRRNVLRGAAVAAIPVGCCRATARRGGFNGIQGRRHGNLHFAGEHTSVNFQGFMEGALRSGYRCAAEVTGR